MQYGSGKAETYNVAIRLADRAFVGSKVVSFSVPLEAAPVSDVKVWLSKELKSEKVDGVKVKVQKTQIAFSNRYNFAFVSFLPVRKAKERPKVYIVVTFGLGYCVESPRIDAAVEPYPGRWTHHVLIAGTGEIDDELMGWVKEAAAFSDQKR